MSGGSDRLSDNKPKGSGSGELTEFNVERWARAGGSFLASSLVIKVGEEFRAVFLQVRWGGKKPFQEE